MSDIVEYGSGPAYDVSAVPECSQGGFCFFCQYSETGAADDKCGSLKSMVRSMAAEQKSLPIIVNAVHRVYERHIRADALTETGNQGPEWSKKSIENHLLYSTEFRELFDSFVERCLQNIIIRQNASLVDELTGEIIEEKRKSFLETLVVYKRMTSQDSGTGRGRPRKPALMLENVE